MKNHFRWPAIAVFLTALVIGYSNCSVHYDFNGTSGSLGTNAGNPLTPTQSAKTLLAAICGTLTRCQAQLSNEACVAGILGASGFGSQLGLTSAFSTYSDIITAEQSSLLTGNSTATSSCASNIQALDCNSTQVQTAYNPASATPFAGASGIVPTSTSSGCQAVFAPNIFYVSPTGSDSNPGTLASPWKTIQHAADTLNPGDTVIVEDGTYVETVTIQRGGTATAPITFRSQNKWGAKIAPTDSQVAALSGNRIIEVGASYVTVQDFEIIGTPSTASGLKCNVGGSCHILGNNIHDIGANATTCFSGAALQTNSDNNVFEGNYIHNIGPARSASFRCSKMAGFDVISGNGGLFRNNFVFEVWQGIGIQLESGSYSNWSISNNSIFNVGDNSHTVGAAVYFSCGSGTCDNNLFNNNIFANTQGEACIWEIQGTGTLLGANNTYRNNVVYNCSANANVNIWVNGNNNYTNTVTTDPQFVNYSGDTTGDYHLKSASPAINAGTSSGAPLFDFDGFTRPSGGAFDIGAIEYH